VIWFGAACESPGSAIQTNNRTAKTVKNQLIRVSRIKLYPSDNIDLASSVITPPFGKPKFIGIWYDVEGAIGNCVLALAVGIKAAKSAKTVTLPAKTRRQPG
jgi:hypothetical protein